MPTTPKVFSCRFEFESPTRVVYGDDDGTGLTIDLVDKSVAFDTMLALSWYVTNTPEQVCEPRLLKLLGRYLFDFLLPPSAQYTSAGGEALGNLQGKLVTLCEQSDTRVHINLLFKPDAARYAQLPWEFLNLPTSKRRAFLSEIANVSVTLTRFIPSQLPITPVDGPLRVLVHVASPGDLPTIAFAKLEAKLAELQKKSGEQLTYVMSRNDDIASLKAQLKKFKPHIFHFCGHGEYDALWLTERDRTAWEQELEKVKAAHAVFGFGNKIESDAFEASIDAIAGLFREHAPELVVLDACNSDWAWLSEMLPGVAHQLVLDVPAVVAMRYPISNESAEKFSIGLYEMILKGRPLDEAVQSARNSLFAADSAADNWSLRHFGTPVLYVKSSSPICSALIPSDDEERQPGGLVRGVARGIAQPERVEECPMCGGEALFTGRRCSACGAYFQCKKCESRFTWHQARALRLCPDCDVAYEPPQFYTGDAKPAVASPPGQVDPFHKPVFEAAEPQPESRKPPRPKFTDPPPRTDGVAS